MIVRHPSAYPEFPRKSAARRLAENLWIYLRDGAPCAAYDGLGLDLKGRRLDDFVSNLRWFRTLFRDLISADAPDASLFVKLSRIASSPLFLLQNKYAFWSFMDRHGIPVVPVLAHSVGGQLFGPETPGQIAGHDRFFAKPVDANCGRSACMVTVSGGRFFAGGRPVDWSGFLSCGWDFVFQPVVENHPALKAFNPSSLNTLRIATCRTRDGRLEPWDPGMLRVGCGDTDVDNFTRGGIAIGLSPDGTLKRFGFSHDEDFAYRKTDRHPVSGIVFEGYTVPFYRESVELVLKAHALLPSLPTAGWDVAVTPDGPLLLEGNHDWDLEVLQAVHHQGSLARFKEVYGQRP